MRLFRATTLGVVAEDCLRPGSNVVAIRLYRLEEEWVLRWFH